MKRESRAPLNGPWKMDAAGAPLAQTKNSYCGDTKHVDFSFSSPFIPQKYPHADC